MAAGTSSKLFSLLCWNIDGLDKANTVERAQAVCKIIDSRKPHAVFLQEVVPNTQMEIITQLGPSYDYFQAPAAEKYGYFASILVLKTEGLSHDSTVECFEFPQSVMGRHLLTYSVDFHGVKINLSTSHLESMKDYGRPRKEQLSHVFQMIAKNDTVSNWIFGGDLNVRDHEVKSVGVPDSMIDVWEATGSEAAHKFTWDTNENDNLQCHYNSKQRFDRVYLKSDGGHVTASSVSLVGKERLEGCRRFPSDHWGLWIEFNVHC